MVSGAVLRMTTRATKPRLRLVVRPLVAIYGIALIVVITSLLILVRPGRAKRTWQSWVKFGQDAALRLGGEASKGKPNDS